MGHHHRISGRTDGRPKGKLKRATEALYWKEPAPEDIPPGFLPEDYSSPEVDLWPENWPAIDLFTKLHTQWRIGVNGPIGLDYNVVLHELDRRGLNCDDYDDLFGCIREIEQAALIELRK